MNSILEVFADRRFIVTTMTIVGTAGAILVIFNFIQGGNTIVSLSLPLQILSMIAGVLTVLIMISTTFRISSASERISSDVKNVKQSLTPTTRAVLGAVDKKKEQFLSIPNISFHFANKDEIQSFYNDYFKEPTIEQVVSELTGEFNSEAKASVPQLLESKIGGKDISKWISTIKLPDISVAEMFRRYQRETIKNSQVTLGLELVDIDLSDLNSFETLLLKLKSDFEFQPDEAQVEKQRTLLKKKAAEKTVLRLENATGWVLAEGKFTISELSAEFYKCVYKHPVNEYLTGDETQVTISIILTKDRIESNIAGNYSQSVGKAIPLRVYGKVWQPLDRKSGGWELQISPLAVY